MGRKQVLVFVGLVLAAAGCNRGPFSYVDGKGKITYEDGSLIPASQIRLTFVSLEPTADPEIRPRPADSIVDVSTGEFDSPTSQRHNDGIVRGKHKVIVTAMEGRGDLSPTVPAIYADAAKSPLIVNTDDTPFDLRIPKP